MSKKVVILRGQRIGPGHQGHAYPGEAVTLDDKHADRLIRLGDAVEHSSEAEKRVKDQLARDKAAKEKREADARAGIAGLDEAIAAATKPLQDEIAKLRQEVAAAKK